MSNAPVPVMKGISQTYWEGLSRGKLLIQQCLDCRSQIFYPRILCHHCGSTNVEYLEHNGRGSIYSFTIVHKSSHPFFKEKVPYAIAMIDLEGGSRMMTNIVDSPFEDIRIGSRVQVVYRNLSDTVAIPCFTLL